MPFREEDNTRPDQQGPRLDALGASRGSNAQVASHGLKSSWTQPDGSVDFFGNRTYVVPRSGQESPGEAEGGVGVIVGGQGLTQGPTAAAPAAFSSRVVEMEKEEEAKAKSYRAALGQRA